MALPVNGSTHLIPALLLIYRPRNDERLSWPSWLTYSGWFTHISGHPSAAGRAQDIGKVRQSETDVLPLCYATITYDNHRTVGRYFVNRAADSCRGCVVTWHRRDATASLDWRRSSARTHVFNNVRRASSCERDACGCCSDASD